MTQIQSMIDLDWGIMMYEIYSTQPCAVSNALWCNETYQEERHPSNLEINKYYVSVIGMASYNRQHKHKSQQILRKYLRIKQSCWNHSLQT